MVGGNPKNQMKPTRIRREHAKLHAGRTGDRGAENFVNTTSKVRIWETIIKYINIKIYMYIYVYVVNEFTYFSLISKSLL